MQRDDESPSLASLPPLFRREQLHVKSNLMNHQQSGGLMADLIVMSSQTHPGCGECADICSFVMLMAVFEKRTFS